MLQLCYSADDSDSLRCTAMPSFGNTDISHNNKYYLFQITVETKLGKAIYRQIDQSGNWFRDQYYYKH